VSGLKSFAKSRGGNVAIEFAMIAPVLIAMLLGIVSYGGYFFLAHSLQEITNDAARAAIAGLTSTERQQLAQTQTTTDLSQYSIFNASAASVAYNGDTNGYTITINYDASKSGFWSASGFIPMPSSTIVSTATIKLGGY
jgi:Flp pilus assembly protein TadG